MCLINSSIANAKNKGSKADPCAIYYSDWNLATSSEVLNKLKLATAIWKPLKPVSYAAFACATLLTNDVHGRFGCLVSTFLMYIRSNCGVKLSYRH